MSDFDFDDMDGDSCCDDCGQNFYDCRCDFCPDCGLELDDNYCSYCGWSDEELIGVLLR